MSMDFNDAESNTGDLIPKGTVAPVVMVVRPGKAGDGGWLTQSSSSLYRYMDCEFTVSEGPYRNRKFWSNIMVDHDSPSEERVAKTLGISRSKLRGILESARGIKPDDESDDAKAKRKVDGYGDFSGIEFVAKIGVQIGSGQYSDKNELDSAVPITSKQHPKNGGSVDTSAKGSTNAPNDGAQSGGVPKWAA